MGNYVEKQIGQGEEIVRKSKISAISLIGFHFIPALIAMATTELAITNKQVIGKKGLIRTHALNASLDKIQNVTVSSGLFGKLFKYGSIRITTAADNVVFHYIKDAEGFKKAIIQQQDIYSEEKIKQQATQMASAMASAINK